MNGNHQSIGGVVLCGGESRRMGRPKLSLPIGSETMLARVVRLLRVAVDPVVVVAAPGQEVPELPSDVRIVRDERPGLGPLGGLLTGLTALKGTADAVYASACDTPLLRPAFVERMISHLADYDLAIPREGRFYHPLAAVYRLELAFKIAELLDHNRLRPVYLVEECRSHIVEVDQLRAVDPHLDSLRNTNTPEEYEAVLQTVMKQQSI